MSVLPPLSENLRLKAPIESWEDAIPLGNGMLGALLWGEKSTVKISLDRGDLWDERTTGESRWWAKNPWSSFTPHRADAGAESDPWGHYYTGATPTKLPVGRLELNLAPEVQLREFELDLATAQGRIDLGDHGTIDSLIQATSHTMVLQINGSQLLGVKLSPAGADHADGQGLENTHSSGAVASLGYPPAQQGSTQNMSWYVQEAADSLSYCACVAWSENRGVTTVAVSVSSSKECQPGEDVLTLAQRHCQETLKAGYAVALEAHSKWWEEFWSSSRIEVPNELVQKQYQFTRYLYGSASRLGAPPMPLQGVWTADNGGLPPWKGDYHNDLNTQLSYSAYQQSGDLEAGLSYLEFLWELRQEFTEFARDYYGTSGLASPGVMSLGGQPLGGWSQYALSPTMSAWNAHLFYQHWRYTASHEYLRERAYPWASEVGHCLEELLHPNESGVLVLRLSSSPEIFDNSAAAWLEPNSNYDLMCLKMLFLELAEMAQELDLGADRLRWLDLAEQLGDFHTAESGELLLDASTALTQSHRHLSNIMSIHPFNLTTVDGGERDEQIIAATLAAWKRLGTSAWTGYSWSWMAGLLARAGRGEEALEHAEIFFRAFTSRNGFHINGDQSGKGYSNFTYRPFTLEGNFAAMDAVQQMLLQSWNPQPGIARGEVIRVFPAVSEAWADVSFESLRAEGGHRISAARRSGRMVSLRIIAGGSGMLRVRNNFGDAVPQWSHPDVKENGPNFEVFLETGAELLATFGEAPAAQQSSA